MDNDITSRAVSAICAQQWAITEDALRMILAIADRSQSDLQAVLAAKGQALAGTDSVTIRGSVAILPVRGPIFRYANMFTQVSGATSIEALAADFDAAVKNPAVSTIVLELDSPGGMVAGVSEFAAQVRAATAIKPVIAYVSDRAASAAYWIASAASEIVASDTAALGSIGVVMQARTDASAGVVKFISSQSPRKHLEPQSEAGQRSYQAQVDSIAQVFIESVARYRGVSQETVATKFGQGDVFIGQAAITAGLADRLGSLESVIARFGGASAGGAKNKGATSVTIEHDKSKTFSIDDARRAFSQSPALQAEFRTVEIYCAYARAAHDGRVRIFGANRTGDSATTSQTPRGAFSEHEARTEFRTSADLQAEFVKEEYYVAYARGLAAGKIRILGQRRS